MGMERTFCRTVIGEGQTKTPAYKITCSQCSKVDKIGIGKNSGSLPSDLITKKFKQRGWGVGNKGKDDICHDCFQTRTIKKLNHIMRNPGNSAQEVERNLDTLDQILEQVQEVRPTIEAKIEMEIEKEKAMNFDPKLPPQMTKEDRRIIFGEIDSHYLDETRGYEMDYNDGRIAKSLDVPLAWVRTIREDNFGPERGEVVNEEIEKIQKAIDNSAKTIKKMTDLMAEMDVKINTFTTIRGNLLKEVSAITSAIDAAKAKIEATIKRK